MHIGILTTLLLFIMSSGLYWTDGIIPALVTKILILKGKLLLGPPIALGAFVVGQGSALLITKLIGISLLFTKYGIHPPPPPPPPPFYYTNYPQYYNYDSSFGDGFNYYPPPNTNYHHSSTINNHVPFFTINSPYEFQQSQTIPIKYSYRSPTTTTDEYLPTSSIQHTTHNEGDDDDEHVYDGSETQYKKVYPQTNLTDNLQLGITNTKHEEEESDDDWSSFSSTSAENYIIDQFLNEKDDLNEDTKLDTLADMLKHQFNQEFVKMLMDHHNLKSSKVIRINNPPKHKVIQQQTTSNEPSNQPTPTPSPTPSPSLLLPSIVTQKPILSKQITLLSPLLDVFMSTSTTDFIPDSLMDWLFHNNPSDEQEQEQYSHHHRQKRSPTEPDYGKLNPPLSIMKFKESFIRDLKHLFTIVSFLDINRCLQKMICEIHHRKSNGQIKKLNQYEHNILLTFKIMDKIIPLETSPIDSTTKYRQAAIHGQSPTTMNCIQSFSECTFNTDKIIELGSMEMPIVTGSSQSFLKHDYNPEDMDLNSGI